MATVLVVDDAPLVLQVTKRMIIADGHTVATATSAAEALTLLASQDTVDLLVTDLVLPDRSGVDLIRLALDLRPRLPIIITTGDPSKGGKDFVWTLADLGVKELLRKPYSHGELRDAVVRALQKS